MDDKNKLFEHIGRLYMDSNNLHQLGEFLKQQISQKDKQIAELEAALRDRKENGTQPTQPNI
jgi:hypothetical protein